MPNTILGTTKVGPKNQITIVKEAREMFNIKPEDLIVFMEIDGELVIRKV